MFTMDCPRVQLAQITLPHESLSYLFYKAKMACFFEENKNENKLDILEQVIDIKQWREVKV